MNETWYGGQTCDCETLVELGMSAVISAGPDAWKQKCNHVQVAVQYAMDALAVFDKTVPPKLIAETVQVSSALITTHHEGLFIAAIKNQKPDDTAKRSQVIKIRSGHKKSLRNILACDKSKPVADFAGFPDVFKNKATELVLVTPSAPST